VVVLHVVTHPGCADRLFGDLHDDAGRERRPRLMIFKDKAHGLLIEPNKIGSPEILYGSAQQVNLPEQSFMMSNPLP